MPSVTTRAQIQRFPSSETGSLIDALKKDGTVIITDFCTAADIEQINSETRPYLDADPQWNVGGYLLNPETRRCTRLVVRSAIAKKWIVSDIVTNLTEHFLARTTTNYYGTTLRTYTAHPIIDSSMTMEVGPGGIAQALHRHEKNYNPNYSTDYTKTGYLLGSEVLMGFLVPGIDVMEENGTTKVILGSHLWGADRIPREEESVDAEMAIGEALVMLGRVYHGAGGNSTLNQKRPMHSLFFCSGYLKAGENQYLISTKEEVLSWSPEVQEKMGFHLSSPNLGFCDFRSPVVFLKTPVVTEPYIPFRNPDRQAKD